VVRERAVRDGGGGGEAEIDGTPLPLVPVPAGPAAASEGLVTVERALADGEGGPAELGEDGAAFAHVTDGPDAAVSADGPVVRPHTPGPWGCGTEDVRKGAARSQATGDSGAGAAASGEVGRQRAVAQDERGARAVEHGAVLDGAAGANAAQETATGLVLAAQCQVASEGAAADHEAAAVLVVDGAPQAEAGEIGAGARAALSKVVGAGAA